MKHLLLTTLLLTTQAHTATYNGQNIDDEWRRCRGVRDTDIYYLDEFSVTTHGRWGYEDYFQSECRFSDRFLTIRNVETNQIRKIYLHDEKIPNPFYAYSKHTEGDFNESYFDSKYKIYVYFSEEEEANQ